MGSGYAALFAVKLRFTVQSPHNLAAPPPGQLPF
jgi:hypothetical protein